jgi:hypothetical protein
MTLHSKMLPKKNKTKQSHCTSNLIFADVLNNGYMDKIFSPKIKISRFEKYKVECQIWRP